MNGLGATRRPTSISRERTARSKPRYSAKTRILPGSVRWAECRTRDPRLVGAGAPDQAATARGHLLSHDPEHLTPALRRRFLRANTTKIALFRPKTATLAGTVAFYFNRLRG